MEEFKEPISRLRLIGPPLTLRQQTIDLILEMCDRSIEKRHSERCSNVHSWTTFTLYHKTTDIIDFQAISLCLFSVDQRDDNAIVSIPFRSFVIISYTIRYDRRV